MTRSNTTGRRAPPRPAARYSASSSRRPPRPARPSHLRREARRNWLWPAFAALIVVLALGGIVFWQSRQARASEAPALAAEQAASAPAAAEVAATATPTETRALVTNAAIPGGEAGAAVATVQPPAAGEYQAATPAAAGTATVVPTLSPSDTPAPPAQDEPTPAETAGPAAATAPPAAPVSSGEPDLAALAQAMLDLVNQDRAREGLNPVAWDPIAADAGQKHAEEMTELGYMSHWNIDGYGPEHRYSRAGGLDYSQENVYRLVHHWEDGSGAPIDDWQKVIRDAQAALMNSPGHRANILAAEHTHLGVGIAYRASTGTVSISQEFVNRYVAVEPLPRRARPGERVVVRGTLLPGSGNPLINVAYEPFPAPMTLDELNQTGTYTPRASHLAVPQTVVGQDGRFYAEYVLDEAASPGLYHILLWVDSPVSPEKVPSVNAVIEVTG